MPGAEKGDLLLVHFTSRTSEGEVFESSLEGDPQEVRLGEGKINPVFEEALTGMKPGDKKTVSLPAEKAYGNYKSRLVFRMKKKHLNLVGDPVKGDMVNITLPNGKKALVEVVESSGKYLKVDGNHPMAGEDMEYEIILVDILPDEKI